MNKISILLGLVILSGMVFYLTNQPQQSDAGPDQDPQSLHAQSTQVSGEYPTEQKAELKLLTSNEFLDKYKLNEREKKFLENFSKTEADLVIAEAVLLSFHDPKSPLVNDLKKAVLLNPKLSIESISKFIGNEDLPGADLQKSALLDLGKEIAIDEESKKNLVDASTSELYKVMKSLPDLPSENLSGPEREMNFIKSLNKEEAGQLASAINYFKHASEGTDGVSDQKEVISILKEIDNSVVKNILARNYYESNKDKLDPTAIDELRGVGVSFDDYSKKPSP